MSFGSRWLKGVLERSGLAGMTEALRSAARCLRAQVPTRRWGVEEVPPAASPEPLPLEREAAPAPREAAVAPGASEEGPGAAPARKLRSRRRPPVPARAAAGAKVPRAARPKKARSGEPVSPEAGDAVARLVEALRAHPRHEALVAAGRRKDQLLRSLIPLYLARALDVEVTSGTTSRFWKELGVTYAAPNAAKVLRLKAGHARETRKGRVITSQGARYVETALERQG